MKFSSKTTINLLFVLLASQVYITTAMEMPQQTINPASLALLRRFIRAEKKHDFNFYTSTSSETLESVITLVVTLLENQKDFEKFAKEIKINKFALKTFLNDIIKNADKVLSVRPITAPVEKPKEQKVCDIKSNVIPPVLNQAHVAFSNQTSDKIVTAWVASGANNIWEIIKLLPFTDSQEVISPKGFAIYLYIGSEGLLLLPKENYVVLAKEVINDTWKGQRVSKYIDTQEIKRVHLKYPEKIMVIVNPDSSVSFAEKL